MLDDAPAPATRQRGLLTGLRVGASIQGDELRVAGKNRDDLQAVMTACRGHDFPVALNFVNFRD